MGLHVLFVVADHLRSRNRPLGRIKIQIFLHADKYVLLDADIRFNRSAHAMTRILAVEEVVRHMHLAKTHARHALLDAIRPPGMMNRDIQMFAVRCFFLVVANEVTELMPCRSGSIAELRPRNRDVIRSIGNIQIAIVPIINIDMVNPYVLGFVIHLQAILVVIIMSTRTLEYQVTDDDVLRAAQLHGTARTRLRNDSALVAVNGDIVPDIDRAHVRTRFHVDNLVARLGIALEIISIIHHDFGIARATGSATVLRRKSHHREIRRCNRKGRSDESGYKRYACNENPRPSCQSFFHNIPCRF